MTSQIAMGSRAFLPSSRYIAFFPCFQASPDLTWIDRSGKGNNGSLGTLTAAEAWNTTANRLSSLASANKHPYLSKAIIQANWRWNQSFRDSFLVSFRIKPTLANSEIFGTCFGVAEGGFKASITAGGGLSVALYDRINATVVGGGVGFTDAVWASEHTITIWLDGINNSYSVYVDGVVYVANASLATTPVLELGGPAYDFNFTACLNGSVGVAASLYNVHILSAAHYSQPGFNQANLIATRFLEMDRLALRLHNNPNVLAESEFIPRASS